MNFTDFYSSYPRKVAKAHAEKMWNRLKESEKQDALAALPYHVAMWTSEKRSMAMVPHAGSWIGGKRWQDDEEPRGQEDCCPEDPILEQDRVKPVHFCDCCAEPHIWECRQPDVCCASKDLACPEFASRYLPKGKGL